MTLWQEINQDLIKKALSEFSFEEMLPIKETQDHYILKINDDLYYKFKATKSIWNHLRVHGDIQRIESHKETNLNAQQFFIDINIYIKTSDITLSNYLEEINNTLYSDLEIKNQTITSDEILKLNGDNQQCFLSGHPKLLPNKGRIGFSSKDLDQYAPESRNPIQFRWVLVKKEKLKGLDLTPDTLWTIDQSFSIEDEKIHILKQIESKLDVYDLMPIHPWQWDNVIKMQFQDELQNETLIDLGVAGDSYLPQASIRTLSNITSPKKYDIKVPVSILNTSCVRGLPHKYLSITPKLSFEMENIVQNDELLKSVIILKEMKAVALEQNHFHQIKDAAYRYHEQLGAVWRESSQLNSRSILSGVLIHQDHSGKTVFESYLDASGLSASEWLKKYAQTVVLPLYHLQAKYGIGLVSHGQNIMVQLKDSAPCGLVLKDFHGDLRLAKGSESVASHKELTKLPPEHLIHDLYTGHFITVLRFLSGTLEDRNIISETDFYKIFATVIEGYGKTNPAIDLLQPTFPKVLVNKVRFQIGYGDNAKRPIPMLGSEINNPLYLSLRKESL